MIRWVIDDEGWRTHSFQYLHSVRTHLLTNRHTHSLSKIRPVFMVGIAKNLTGDTYQLRPAVVLTPLLFVYSSLRCPTFANLHNKAHKISLSHSGLILAWKVESVCMSWSPLKKKKKCVWEMNRRFFQIFLASEEKATTGHNQHDFVCICS